LGSREKGADSAMKILEMGVTMASSEWATGMSGCSMIVIAGILLACTLLISTDQSTTMMGVGVGASTEGARGAVIDGQPRAGGVS